VTSQPEEFDLLDVLELEPLEVNLYRANLVLDEEHALFGGQVAAQALRAAGLTVDPERRASFHSPHESWAAQAETMPATPLPDDLPPRQLHRLLSIEARIPAQPFSPDGPWLNRFWARSAVKLPADPLIHDCALTYLSDIGTGIMPAADGSARPGPSLDHALWFHGAVDMNDWVLSEYHPQVSGHGRGWYTGSVFTPDGTLIASIAQEQLFR
jgi:acyl-CoA thioesterase-2